ncbi:bifunctional biotin--[acetyl-CoA-carboxylase] ligase/biotin operon repressor BirA [Pseudomonas sp. UL073]|uniref:Bifunctional ligase/repressor BirA n=1 Tax=Zestomonas insulae TaxID=2809017 RepID=A0ABS2IIC7_9GAMM|nr:bifunctional biotin--[acetyl-CoA-carboxylase] ligase/biotin operon repressor BirA [Pseudomonas insulae]MBM7062702.1 bifunctional biotin--[acetyl-CoA-carboxylase] ligase/biotin operon repressor BirA [Pseudomonas insulae]
MNTLLELLQDGSFHSGSVLGTALGVSRSAVWKQLQIMESELGVTIHRVRGRGYRLENPISLLNAGQLVSSCADEGWELRLHERVDSTNAEALRSLSGGTQSPVVVLAESQTAGRGRRGRDWVSPFAENLYYSLVFRLENGAAQLEGLSLVVGLAVLQSLRELGVSSAGLKWPNDILVNGKKIAGILLELTGDPADVCHVVVGIGINANMRATDEAIDQPWTSVALELGALCDRTALVTVLNRRLGECLRLHREKGFSALRAEWEANHLWQGCSAVLTSGAQCIEGRVLGIDNQGALRLETNDGERHYSGGELSLRLRNDS